MISLLINGQTHQVDVPADMPLLWVLRDVLGMTGTKFGCGIAQCGACTVHVDGEPVRSCLLPASAVGSRPVTTIEAIGRTPNGRKVQQAWIDKEVLAMRLLPVRPDHVRDGVAEPDAETDRCRHRRRDVGQHLPMRHLCAHPRSHPHRSRGVKGRAMGHHTPSRRSLLKVGLLAGGGLMLGLRLPSLARAAPIRPRSTDQFAPNAFLRIDPRGAITLIMPHAEVGQGVYTSSAMLMGEELEVGLGSDPGAASPARSGEIHGSVTLRSGHRRFDLDARGLDAPARGRRRRAHHAGRRGCQRWGVDPATCRVERGVVHHDASGRTLGYGEVASDAARQPVPKDVKLKDPAQFKLIGTNAKRLDTPSKVNGTAVFGIDIKVPGMRIGTLAITPVKGGKLVSMDEAAARACRRTDDRVPVARCHPRRRRSGGGDRRPYVGGQARAGGAEPGLGRRSRTAR